MAGSMRDHEKVLCIITSALGLRPSMTTVGMSFVSSHFSGRELAVWNHGGKGGMRSGEEIDWAKEKAAPGEAAFSFY
jgi:hypothetical protein